MRSISNCAYCGEKLTFYIVRNRKYWIYGTLTFIGFILSLFLMILLKVIGLVLALILDWYLWNWYTQKIDYMGYCKKCNSQKNTKSF